MIKVGSIFRAQPHSAVEVTIRCNVAARYEGVIGNDWQIQSKQFPLGGSTSEAVKIEDILRVVLTERPVEGGAPSELPEGNRPESGALAVSTVVGLRYERALWFLEDDEVAHYIRRFLRHPAFRDKGNRLGKVVRVRRGGLSYWTVGSEKQGATSW